MSVYFLSLLRLMVCFLLALHCCARAEDTLDYSLAFEWLKVNSNGKDLDKAAILLPIGTIQERRVYVQLDTGSPKSHLYAWAIPYIFPSAAAASSSKDTVQWDLALSTLTGKNFPFKASAIQHGDPASNVVGILGLDALNPFVLHLNFPKKQIRLVKTEMGQIVNNESAEGTVNFAHTPNHLAINIEMNGKTVGPVLLDTGSASFDLVLYPGAPFFSEIGLLPIVETQTIGAENTLSGELVFSSYDYANKVCIIQHCSAGKQITLLNKDLSFGYVGVLGMKSLISGELIVDFVHKKVSFLRAKDGPTRLSR